MALPAPLVPVDYGYVTLNYDKTWFNKRAVALPKTLDELAQPGAAKLTYTAMPTYTKTAPLRPSGLIGPVVLMVQGK